jgi:predicted tellurium resistance membrane protein TerC
MDWITDPNIWIGFLTLTVLEIVLGIDNIVFISILCGRLPPKERSKARTIGLFLAMFMRIALLVSLAWMVKLTAPLFTVLENEISGRDLILIAGGLFLLAKATREIHHKVEGDGDLTKAPVVTTFASVIVQVLLIDLVFSLDSVITAVGMVEEIGVMVAAIVVAVSIMLWASGWVSAFVDRHPTVKMLALSFLLLIGVTLMADGLEFHIPRGYVYFAMAFSVFVEVLNLKASRGKKETIIEELDRDVGSAR